MVVYSLRLQGRDTVAHVKRMTDIVAPLPAVWTNEKAISDIFMRRQCILGKIGIPDKILLKPGTLDPVERDIMKLHTSSALKSSVAQTLNLSSSVQRFPCRITRSGMEAVIQMV